MQRAEDETARLYAEFVESFQDDSVPGSKTFVRGGTINPNDKLKTDTEGWCYVDRLFMLCFLRVLFFFLRYFIMFLLRIAE